MSEWKPAGTVPHSDNLILVADDTVHDDDFSATVQMVFWDGARWLDWNSEEECALGEIPDFRPARHFTVWMEIPKKPT